MIVACAYCGTIDEVSFRGTHPITPIGWKVIKPGSSSPGSTVPSYPRVLKCDECTAKEKEAESHV